MNTPLPILILQIMARLKSAVQEEAVEQTIKGNAETAGTEVANEKATKGKVNDTIESTDVPEFADKILKMYPQYAKLAIDAQGGVYSEDSQHLSKGKAILYQNPYYKQ